MNADADPYRFLPKPAPRAAKAVVTAPRAGRRRRGGTARAPELWSGGAARGGLAPPAPVSEPAAAPAPAPAGRPSTGAFSDLGEDAAARCFSDLGRGDDAPPPPPPAAPRHDLDENTPEAPAVWDSSHLQASASADSAGDAQAFGCLGDIAAAFSDDAADAPATRRVSKTGYLRKRGRMNPAWKTRWCEAWPDEGRLYYFREYNEKRCRGYIECSRITICESLDDGSFSDCDDFTSRPTAPYAFRVRTPGAKHGEEWMLQAASAAERDAWIQCLRGMMGGAAPPRASSGMPKAPREEGVCALM